MALVSSRRHATLPQPSFVTLHPLSPHPQAAPAPEDPFLTSQADRVRSLSGRINALFNEFDTGRISLDVFRERLRDMGLRENPEVNRLLRQTPVSFSALLKALTYEGHAAGAVPAHVPAGASSMRNNHVTVFTSGSSAVPLSGKGKGVCGCVRPCWSPRRCYSLTIIIFFNRVCCFGYSPRNAVAASGQRPHCLAWYVLVRFFPRFPLHAQLIHNSRCPRRRSGAVRAQRQRPGGVRRGSGHCPCHGDRWQATPARPVAWHGRRRVDVQQTRRSWRGRGRRRGRPRGAGARHGGW